MPRTDFLALAVIVILALLLAVLVLPADQLVKAAFVVDAVATTLVLIETLTRK